MAEKGASLFSFGRKARGAGTGAIVVAPDASETHAYRRFSGFDIGAGVKVPEASTDAYSPYAEKWKEFDKLQKLAKGGGKIQWFHWLWGMIVPALGIVDRHRVPKKDAIWIVAFWAALGAVAILRAQAAKSRFLHWPCPRCGAEWPGTKTEKEPRCAMCGLKLHQMTP
ncbi:MAG TPA: hypothetical protein VEJ46_15475 [Candidatus Acidoferrum sp.]|nr:hypothetical protein [Candidatus Acidoferrum sp.]